MNTPAATPAPTAPLSLAGGAASQGAPVSVTPSPPPDVPSLLWKVPGPVFLFLALIGLVSGLLLSLKGYRPLESWAAPFSWHQVLRSPEVNDDTILPPRQVQRWRELAVQQPIQRRSIHLRGTPRQLDIELTLTLAKEHPLVAELSSTSHGSWELRLLAQTFFGTFTANERNAMEGQTPVVTWTLPPQASDFVFTLRSRYSLGGPLSSGRVSLAALPEEWFIEDELILSFDELLIAGLEPVPSEATAASARFQTSKLGPGREVHFLLNDFSKASDSQTPLPEGAPQAVSLRKALGDSARLLSHEVIGPLTRMAFFILLLPLLMGWIAREFPQPLLASESFRHALRKLLVFQFSLPVLLALFQAPGRVDALANVPVDFASYRDWNLSWLIAESCLLASAVFLFVTVPGILLQDLPGEVPPPGVLPTFRRAVSQAWRLLGLACKTVLLGMSTFALAYVLWELALQEWVSHEAGMMLLGSVTALLASGSLATLHWLLAGRRPPRGLAWVGGVLLVASAAISSQDGIHWPPGVLKNGFWLGLGAVLGLVLVVALLLAPVPLVRSLLPEAAPGTSASPFAQWLSQRPWWQWLGLGCLLLLVTIPAPLHLLIRSSLQDHWALSSQFNFPYELARLLPLGAYGGALLLLHQRGRASPRVDELSRRVALVALAAVLFLPDVWSGLPVQFVLGLASLWVLARPTRYWKVLEPLMERVVSRREELLNALLMMGAVERGARDVRKSLHEKLGTGELEVELYVEQLEKTFVKEERLASGTAVEGHPVRDVAFAFAPHATAWRNGVHGALWASLFAAPWTLLFLLNWLETDVNSYPYPLLSFCIDMLSHGLKWAAYGFGFGYFYPYLRGRSGLGKSLHLFLAVALPLIPGMLLVNSAPEHWKGSGLEVLQLFILCLTLGLFAFDYQILRKARHHWRMLFEIHGLPSVGISLSSLLIAMGATVTTLLNSGLQGMVKMLFNIVLPNVAPRGDPPLP